MPSKGSLIYHLTCLLYATYLGKLYDPTNHEISLKLQISVMVFITLSKMVSTELIFVIPGMKVNASRPITVMFYSVSRYGACCRQYVRYVCPSTR